jgi:hypothetical protein
MAGNVLELAVGNMRYSRNLRSEPLDVGAPWRCPHPGSLGLPITAVTIRAIKTGSC